ncbi:hypothetical protein KUTeg_022833 [Tegillarca granosa]|uniref:glutathione transferase n=1 Tax=Tegillarca granosa TaxID=220873 RepID=A0ABQ9DZY6_TEGGR|nr:hypothetical protein KUTeg_022833 [Tegillarca granosa]
MPTYKLTYFNIRGRAELTRLVFVASGTNYEDNRIEREKWPAIKESMPQGQLPILEVDGFVLPQSLFGRNNLEQAQADVVVQTCEDLRSNWVTAFREKDETKKVNL